MFDIGFFTLLKKELLRFYKVAFQTIAAPVLTSFLFLIVFSSALKVIEWLLEKVLVI